MGFYIRANLKVSLEIRQKDFYEVRVYMIKNWEHYEDIKDVAKIDYIFSLIRLFKIVDLFTDDINH